MSVRKPTELNVDTRFELRGDSEHLIFAIIIHGCDLECVSYCLSRGLQDAS